MAIGAHCNESVLNGSFVNTVRRGSALEFSLTSHLKEEDSKMNISYTLKRLGLEQVFNYMHKDPEKNLIKVMDWADKFSGGDFPTQRAVIRKAIEDPEHPYHGFITHLMTDTDLDVMKTLICNFFINANLAGWPVQAECRKKYGCNVP